MNVRALALSSALSGALAGCTTTFIEFEGECVMQQWSLASVVVRRRNLCDLPPREPEEEQLRDQEAMEMNPFPDLFDLRNEADSTDPNLLEKKMGVPQEDGEEASTSH